MKNHSKYNVDLILKNTDALSGTPKILMRQAFALAEDNYDVSVISETFHPSLLSSHQVKCLKTFKWPKSSLFQRKAFDWQARRKVRPDSLVIGHGDTLFQDILFLHTCAEKGSEVAPGPHNNKNYSIPFHRMIFEQGRANEVICVSHMMKNDIQARYNVKVPMHVLHPCHDKNIVNQVNPAAVQEIRNKLNVSSGQVVVAVIASGNLENRGAFTLLRSMALLTPEEREKIKVLIVGKESRPSKVYQLAEEVGMKDKVLWMEPRPDVGNIISAADIVVHAAHIEASGLTFLEFMALSRPVISTETVGFSEILPSIQKDFVVKRQDAQEIAEKLKVLIADPELRQRLGEENRKVAELMTWESYDQKFMEIVGNYLERKNFSQK
jgi:glycosyltransferase involved in cell wall biosynthesis